MNSIYPLKSPEHPAPSLEARRTSQRQPLACQQCAKAKTRCDKTIPCYRCRRRSLDCQREDVIVSRQSKRGVRPTTTASSLTTPPATYPASDTRYTGTSDLHQSSRPTARQTVSNLAFTGEFQDSPTAIEGLAWGRHQCHSYPHTHCRQFKRPESASEAASLVSPNVLEALPSVSLARRLVDYHIQNLCWYHNVLHTPTFFNQCEGFWHDGIAPHDQWIAVYCAVLSSAAWTLSNSSAADDLTRDMVELAEAMMRQTKAVLYDTDFLGNHSLFAVQAIGIISMVTHSFGESDLMATLVNAGIRIAQCLGLHRIPDDVSEKLSAEEGSEVSWQREVGRRVWWKLVELDYHSMPYTGTLTINPKSFSTRMPLNSDDDRLIDRDVSILTISTCAIIMSKIARLMPDILEGAYATERDETAKYQQVILADRRMRELVATLPAVTLRRQVSSQEPQCSWIATARRTLAISAADKIIMIHRSFLLKSLQSPLYLFTRNTCVSAAMTILREHGELSRSGSGCFSIWVHSAFCVTATVVLCLNILHADKQVPPSLRSIEQQLDLVMSARARLESQRCDVMARRGVHLIDAMLEERDRLRFHSTSSRVNSKGEMSFDRIARRFFELEDSNDDRTMGSSDPVVDAEGLSMTDWPQEFDVWFHSTFKY